MRLDFVRTLGCIEPTTDRWLLSGFSNVSTVSQRDTVVVKSLRGNLVDHPEAFYEVTTAARLCETRPKVDRHLRWARVEGLFLLSIINYFGSNGPQK